MMSTSRTPSKRVLALLVDGIGEIIDEFGWAGFAENEGVARDASGTDEQQDNNDVEEYQSRPSRFPRENIEIGIDRFNSTLLKAKAVKKHQIGRQPSLWQVFASLYGE